jgi:hypothetical protein
LVVSVLCLAPAWLGLRRDHHLVAGHLRDSVVILLSVENGRLVDGTVFELGDFCDGSQFCDLAIERWVRESHV